MCFEHYFSTEVGTNGICGGEDMVVYASDLSTAVTVEQKCCDSPTSAAAYLTLDPYVCTPCGGQLLAT